MVDPYDLPSVSPSVIGFDTSGQPVFAPPSRTVAELARVTDAPISRQTAITFRKGVSPRQREQLERVRVQRALDESRRLARERKAQAEARKVRLQVEARQQFLRAETEKRQAKQRGLSVAKLRQQKEIQSRQQQRAVTTSESLRGLPQTRLQRQRALGGATGVSRLRKGTRAEQLYFKQTGVSVSQQRREPVKEKVMSLQQTYAPIKKQKLKEEKFNVRQFLGKKYVSFAEPIVQKAKPLFPEGKTRSFLFEKRVEFDPTELGISLAVSPFLMTTPQTKGFLLERGIIEPITKTKFKSLVSTSGKISKVKVVSTTDVGGVKTAGFSQQIVRQQGDELVVGAGKGVSVVGRGGGERQITKFDIVGVNKQLGQARATFDVGDGVLVSRGIGKGVQSKVITQNVQSIVKREGVGLIRFQKITKVDLPKFESATFSPTGKLTFKSTAKTSDIIGVISPSRQEGVLQFIGKAGKPVTRISKGGVVKVIRDPNIAGIIKTAPTFSRDVAGLGSQKTITQISPTQISPTIQKSVTSQVGGLTSISKQVVVKDITKPLISKSVSKITPSIVTSISPRAIFKDQTKQAQKPMTFGRIKDLGVMDSRIKTGQATIQLSKLSPKAKLRTVAKQRETLKQISPTKQKSIAKLKQTPKQKVLLRTATKQQFAKQVFSPIFAIKTLKIPPTTPLIPFAPIFKPRKVRRRTGRFTVFERRFGKFRPIGTSKSLSKAFSIGKEKVSRTLGASFKIKGLPRGRGLGLPFGFRRSKKEKGIFIEKRKYRLSKKGEKLEIARAKRRRKKKK